MPFELLLLRAIFDDELGPIARDYVGSTESWQALIALLKTPASAWWDDRTTPAREGAAAIISGALDRAGDALRATLGGPSRWTWGRLHRLTLAEATLGVSGIGPLEWYFNGARFPVAGAAGALNNTYYRPSLTYPDPYDAKVQPVGMDRTFSVTNGPSYRLTIDMADLDGARIIQTTGQSGNPFDRHYGDLASDWATGGTVPLPFSTESVARSAVATLLLTP